jgi:hypothetical protein
MKLIKQGLNMAHEAIDSLNTNMFFAGIMMLTLNIGSRYVQLNLSDSTESFLKYAITREFLIFAVAWMGTRNIYIALCLTAVFVILAEYAFNEDSKFCVIPKEFSKLKKYIDVNNDKIISDKELNDAMLILEKAKKQRENRVQLGYVSSYNNKINVAK